MGSKVFEKMIEIAGKSTFCYANSGGEGFTFKENCECFCNKELNCQAYKDKQKFHSYFEGVDYGGFDFLVKRREIINNIKDEFKDSQWYKDNVIE